MIFDDLISSVLNERESFHHIGLRVIFIHRLNSVIR